jgi:hypothetical protein
LFVFSFFFFFCSMQEIVPGLFLGPITCAKSEEMLRAAGITHRVTCLTEVPISPSLRRAFVFYLLFCFFPFPFPSRCGRWPG